MATNGTNIVDLLKQRETELAEELERVRGALKALGSSRPSTVTTTPTATPTPTQAPAAPAIVAAPKAAAPKAAAPKAAAPKAAAPKKKAGRPPASVGGQTVLSRIEEVIAAANRSLQVKEIVKRVKAPYSTIAATLRRGAADKRLVNPSFGIWTLPGLAATSVPAKKSKTKKAARKAAKKSAKSAKSARATKKAAKKSPKKTARKATKQKGKKAGPARKASTITAAAVMPPAAPVTAAPAPPPPAAPEATVTA